MKHKARKIRKAPAQTNGPKVYRTPATREDSWTNLNTNLGVIGRDKRLGVGFQSQLISMEVALDIWRGDDLGARGVEIIPNEMLREGFEVAIEDDKESSEACDSAVRDLNVVEKVRTGLNYGRALGGGAMLLGVDDGASLEVPLREDRIRSLDWINVLTPRECQPVKWYGDPAQAQYGEVAFYRVIPIDTPPGTSTVDFPLVHESRIVRFAGVETSNATRFRNATVLGWDDSIFVRVGQVLADFQAAWQATGILLQDFAPEYLKVIGLAQLLASKSSKGTPNSQEVRNRVNNLSVSGSVGRVRVLDKDEEFGRATVNVAGLADLLDKLMLRLAAAFGMPVSLLMGQAPAGLNATGDSDIRWFYDQISALQERLLRPALTRIIKLLMLSKTGPMKGKALPENWCVRFNPLWQLTDVEKEDLRLKVAQRDQIYISTQVLMPEEVARDRFSGDEYSAESQVDLTERADLMAQAAEREAAAQVAGCNADPQGPAAQAAKAAAVPDAQPAGK